MFSQCLFQSACWLPTPVYIYFPPNWYRVILPLDPEPQLSRNHNPPPIFVTMGADQPSNRPGKEKIGDYF
ncbi:hypothetical protein Syun_012945 [Stephania yunnanensis]|uniref:Uncharacterized protein n=1 Tax=Stephania yunnanensis TaxID=152371 RepID=A0AAP0PJE0_9MAGN